MSNAEKGEAASPVELRFDSVTIQNPYPMFARLRAADPVHKTPTGIFVITRYADLVAVLKDPRFGRAGLEASLQQSHGLGDQRMYILPMMFSDPPDHTRLRAVLNRAFTLRVVEALVPQIERVTNELLDRVDARGSFELIEDLAYKLPIVTICHLLGMPEADHDKITALSQAHAEALATGGVREETKQIIERAHHLRLEWAGYFRALVEERRHAPKNDIVSELVRAQQGTERLSEYELIATLVGLLFAGHTTTTDTLGTGVLHLLSNREQWELFVREPTLLDTAVEEVLRYDPAIQIYVRRALQDAEVAGVAIPNGAFVWPVGAAANRDPAHFPNPERFDITRSPNKHVTFSSGIHFCMGSTLARVQVKTVLGALRRRYPRLALGTEHPTFRPNAFFRGLTRLELTT
jgi:cytochrome P450